MVNLSSPSTTGIGYISPLGFDMSYNPAMQMGHHMFDNVFVNPAAYKAFVETGTWPDKTVLVLGDARR